MNDLDVKLAEATAPPLLGAVRSSGYLAHGVCAAPAHPTLRTDVRDTHTRTHHSIPSNVDFK